MAATKALSLSPRSSPASRADNDLATHRNLRPRACRCKPRQIWTTAIEITLAQRLRQRRRRFSPSSGSAARKFRYEAPAGNIGVNIGVAAPMAYFPFSGWKDSFLGVLHGQGRDGVEFYTDKKVVVERWPKEWSRKF